MSGVAERTVLIVDDEPNIVVSLEFLMEREGYSVCVARDGREALDAVRRSPPDLILLDVMLPLVNGYEVCRLLRADPDSRRVKIILLTARGGDGEARRGADAGADAYLTKPFATRELLAEVQRLIGP